MTREWLEAQLHRMDLLRNAPESADEYWRIFAHMPERVIAAGVTHAIRTRSFFPTPAELLRDCDFAKPPVSIDPPRVMSADTFTATIKNPFGGADLTFEVDREWTPYCGFCDDLGQQTLWCGAAADPGRKPWVDVGQCGRKESHYSHEYAARCACWATNPALIRKREMMAEYSKGKDRDAA